MKNDLFENFDFSKLDSPDFKEDSVREVIILPILYKLGYINDNIVRSKSLAHPFIKIGSQKRKINIVPELNCYLNLLTLPYDRDIPSGLIKDYKL